ncbi:HEAT repeat domain-containing protein [candidate division WOR-3 bacterium]|nr:HEAT repeat domain-containing protein [candidate division WOR-3 bacterium]
MRKYFKKGNWEGICECAYILEKDCKGFAVDELTSSFKNKQYHPVFRKMLSDIMDDIKDRKATKGLIEVLDDISDIPFVRASAADTLGDIGGKGVFEALVRNLNDPDDSVRGSCARALGYLGDRRAGDYLIPFVEDESEFVGDNAIGALVLLKDERAFDILLKEMEKVKGEHLKKMEKVKSNYLKEMEKMKYEGKLGSVINCLGRLGDRRAIPYLIEFTKEKIQNL